MTTPKDLAKMTLKQRAAILEWWEERAAILEYDAGLPRAKAEQLARRMILATLKVAQ
jgi:hypothetical protein